jgi:hypothetical protein
MAAMSFKHKKNQRWTPWFQFGEIRWGWFSVGGKGADFCNHLNFNKKTAGKLELPRKC